MTAGHHHLLLHHLPHQRLSSAHWQRIPVPACAKGEKKSLSCCFKNLTGASLEFLRRPKFPQKNGDLFIAIGEGQRETPGRGRDRKCHDRASLSRPLVLSLEPLTSLTRRGGGGGPLTKWGSRGRDRFVMKFSDVFLPVPFLVSPFDLRRCYDLQGWPRYHVPLESRRGLLLAPRPLAPEMCGRAAPVGFQVRALATFFKRGKVHPVQFGALPAAAEQLFTKPRP